MNQQNLSIEKEVKRVMRLRECKLSQNEVAEHGIEVGRLAGEIEQHKKAAKEAESKQDELINVLKKNSVSRETECELRLYYSTRTAEVWDGEEMLEQRAMTDGEFQQDLSLQYGVVEEDEDLGELTKEDLEGVMREEKSKNKTSLVDLR
jgi:hypothetical protein